MNVLSTNIFGEHLKSSEWNGNLNTGNALIVMAHAHTHTHGMRNPPLITQIYIPRFNSRIHAGKDATLSCIKVNE